MLRNCILIVFIFLPLLAIAQVKRAYSLIEKVKYDQAEELLYKSLGKDSLNTGEKYVLSILYFTEDYYNYNIDSAFHYAISALNDYERSDEKKIAELEKDGITKISLIDQKNTIEDFAFKQAKKVNIEKVYIEYLEKYPTSLRSDSVKWYRNLVAFRQTSKVDTWQSYHSFMVRYPEADQFPKAKSNFDKLIYENKTSDGKLASFEHFLSEYPETPYRKEVEKSIFTISTGQHTVDAYLSFINKYPDSPFARLSSARIYHIVHSSGDSEDLPIAINQFLDSDSLKKLENAESSFWFTVMENSSYHLLDQEGVSRINYVSDPIPMKYLCGNIIDPLIMSFIKDSTLILDRLGNLVYSSKGIEDITDMGYGFIMFDQKGKSGIISRTGELILPAIADEVTIIHGQFAAYSVNDLWGVITINGTELIDPQFSMIEEYSSLIRIYNGESNFALLRPEDLKPLIDNEETAFDFRYDDADLLFNGMILTYSGNNQGLITADLEPVIPEEEQELIQLDKGLLIESKEGFRYASTQIDINPGLFWENAEYNSDWISLKGPNGWILISNHLERIVEEHIDSVQLLNRSSVLTYKNGERNLFFLSGKKLKLNSNSRFEIVSSPPTENIQPEYYTLIQEKGSKWLLNASGDTLLTGNFNDIKALGKEYLVITERRGSGLIDFSGRKLLGSEYDGIANYSDGSVTLLKDGKLGYYRLSDTTYIPPVYTRSIRPYNESLYIASMKEGYGIINGSNKKVTEFSFEDIAYFNDSVAWVKKGANWNLYRFYDDTFIEENISRYYSVESGSNSYTYFQTASGMGVLGKKTGTIINATFTEIINVGSKETPLFMAVKYVDEADYYVVVYYDTSGKIIYRQAYSSEKYVSLVCKK